MRPTRSGHFLFVILLFLVMGGLMGCSGKKGDMAVGEPYGEERITLAEPEESSTTETDPEIVIKAEFENDEADPEEQMPPSRYNPPGYPISYIPPANFEKRKGMFDNQDYLAEYFMDVEGSDDPFAENMKVSGFPEIIPDFNEYFSSEVAGVAATGMFSLVDTSSHTTPEGIRYKRWQMRSTFEMLGNTSETVTYVYHEDDYTYMIQGTSTDKDFNRFKDIFDEVGNSFRVE